MKNSPTFAIVGLGLLGGSLGGVLRHAYPNAKVVGVSRFESKIKLAKKKGFITAGTTQLPQAVRSADFVFICTPVDTIQNLICRVDQFTKFGAVVTDVGSTKGSLIRWVERQKFKNIHFVGSHPMAGSHLTGLHYANPNLYCDSFVFITRHKGINQKAKKLLTNVWRKLGLEVVEIDAQKH